MKFLLERSSSFTNWVKKQLLGKITIKNAGLQVDAETMRTAGGAENTTVQTNSAAEKTGSTTRGITATMLKNGEHLEDITVSLLINIIKNAGLLEDVVTMKNVDGVDFMTERNIIVADKTGLMDLVMHATKLKAMELLPPAISV